MGIGPGNCSSVVVNLGNTYLLTWIYLFPLLLCRKKTASKGSHCINEYLSSASWILPVFFFAPSDKLKEKNLLFRVSNCKLYGRDDAGVNTNYKLIVNIFTPSNDGSVGDINL